MGGLEFGLVLAVLAVAVGTNLRARRRRQDTLDALAQLLRGVRTRFNEVTGNGIAFRFETRGSGSNAEHWTEIDVDIPASYPFTLHVRRHAWRDHIKIRNGEMVDVQTGHARFDDAFLIEGAPTEIVCDLFDEPLLRAALEAESHVELTSHREGNRAFVRFATRRWADDVIAACALIEGIALLPRRLRAVYAAADRDIPTELVGGPYRPEASDRPARETAARREHEVARVERLRATRESLTGSMVIGLLYVLLIGTVVAIVAQRL
jgi:hypothetical protein